MPAVYPPAGQVTWVAGQRLDAADLNPWPPPRVAWGIVDQATITSSVNLSSGSYGDVAGLSITFTAVADRLYKITAMFEVTSTAGGDAIDMQITDGSDTELKRFRCRIGANSFAESTFAAVTAEPGAGSVTYKVRGQRGAAGSGTGSVVASATSPALIVVEDVGPAS